jgi:PKD repeat protein
MSRPVVGAVAAVLMALGLGFPLSAGALATNVVPNPGFEQGGCGSTPRVCGWDGYPNISQDTTTAHSGSASGLLSCGPLGCYAGGGPVTVSASTDPSFCAAIGPGTHPASFWALTGGLQVALVSTFYQGPDCTGPIGSDFFDDWFSGLGWQQFAGDLVAPLGTRSATFMLSASAQCDDYCGLSANFDDVDVEDSVAADTTAPQTTITDAQAGGAATSAVFWFSASEVAKFECSLDGRPFAPCVSPVSYSRLGAGSHTFQVRSIDRAGNIDPTPAEQTWTVESVGDFSIRVTPDSLSVVQGTGATASVQTTVTSGSAQAVDLMAGVQPAGSGLTAWFSPDSIMAGDRATLIVNTAAATPPGNYTITITGVGASWTHSITLHLAVTCCGSDFAIAAKPSTLTLAPGSSGTSTIETTLTSGSAQTVLLGAVGLPAVVSSVYFVPGTVSMGGSSTMTVTVGAAAVPGTYAITVRGATPDGSAIHDTTVYLIVPAAVNKPPTARFALRCSGLRCSFDASSSRDPDGWIRGYAWHFGDGSTPSPQITTKHTYRRPGTYTIRLKVTDNAGATATASKTVRLSK